MKESIRVLYAREHTTVFSKLGAFLAGPTPPNGAMENGWRAKIIKALQNDERLNPSMTVVAPEPKSGYWKDIEVSCEGKQLEEVLNKQIPWEWQYLNLCDITVFWLPTYWNEEDAGVFPANIGPTSRWEFGFFLQEYLKDRQKRHFIIGAPEDAESVKWAKRMTDVYNIKWHTLKKEDKEQLVPQSLIDEIADTLVKNQWEY